MGTALSCVALRLLHLVKHRFQPLESGCRRFRRDVLLDVVLPRRFHVGVPQDSLNRSLVHAQLKQIRGEPTPKTMPSCPRSYTSFLKSGYDYSAREVGEIQRATRCRTRKDVTVALAVVGFFSCVLATPTRRVLQLR
jgi:hypothetical protein